jgi:small subunit ribosomal protein S5
VSNEEKISEEVESTQPEIDERVVFVNRCSKVVKGGRRFSFSAVVVAGNHNGLIGYGFGKANEVVEAIRKGGEMARKSMICVTTKEKTIPHEVTGVFDGGRVLLRPASPGTGVIAGGGMRAVLEVAGIRDVLAKSLGSKNRMNVVKATFAALKKLRSQEEIAAIRQVEV